MVNIQKIAAGIWKNNGFKTRNDGINFVKNNNFRSTKDESTSQFFVRINEFKVIEAEKSRIRPIFKGLNIERFNKGISKNKNYLRYNVKVGKVDHITDLANIPDAVNLNDNIVEALDVLKNIAENNNQDVVDVRFTIGFIGRKDIYIHDGIKKFTSFRNANSAVIPTHVIDIDAFNNDTKIIKIRNKEYSDKELKDNDFINNKPLFITTNKFDIVENRLVLNKRSDSPFLSRDEISELTSADGIWDSSEFDSKEKYEAVMKKRKEKSVNTFIHNYFKKEAAVELKKRAMNGDKRKEQKEGTIDPSGLSVAFYYVITGIQILLGSRLLDRKDDNKRTIKTLEELKAFAPSKDVEFHRLTQCSTTVDRLCVYETYIFFRDNLENIVNNKDYIKAELEKEPEECRRHIKDGFITKFLQTKPGIHYIKFFRPINFAGFKITDGEIEIINNVEEFNGKKVYLWEGQHVAPHKVVEFKNKAVKTEIENNNSNFTLVGKKALKFNVKKVLAFDFETLYNTDGINGDNGFTNPYACCVNATDIKLDENNRIQNSPIKEVLNLYSDCQSVIVNGLIDYIDSIATKYDLTKTHAKFSIFKIHMYGFNNSRFDNLLFYTEFKKRYGSNVEAIIAGNSIKSINYFNVSILDLNLYYAGSLAATAGAFNLDISKASYPYKFATKENLFYVGERPELKYWNSVEDMKECPKDNFNMKEYTLKYCNLDCRLVVEIALKHLQQTIMPINGIAVNNSTKTTAAGIALNLFKTVFLKNFKLRGSPKDIRKLEINSFKGGRTFVNKPFSNDKLLYALDINSAHPASMCKTMPITFTDAFDLKEQIITKDKIVPRYLYSAKSRYIGNDEFVIPNLLIKNPKTKISKSALNTDYAEHWGVELIEAIELGFEITVNKVVQYSTEDENGEECGELFKDYVEFCYNERLKAKKEENEAKSQYLKLLLNSLYGKLAEKEFTTTELFEDGDYAINRIIEDETKKIVAHSLVIDRDDENKKFIKLEYIDDRKSGKSVGELVRLASYITAETRCKLSKLSRVLGSKHVYYCDTDSIYTDKCPERDLTPKDLEEHFHDKILGKWKVEKVNYNCIFDGAKSYTKKNLDYIKGATEKHYRLLIDLLVEDEESKNKGIKGSLLTSADYNNQEPVNKTITMFKRSIEGVRIINQVRAKNITYNNNRIFDLETNSSRPFERVN